MVYILFQLFIYFSIKLHHNNAYKDQKEKDKVKLIVKYTKSKAWEDFENKMTENVWENSKLLIILRNPRR